MIDKILTDKIKVPVHARNDFKMVFQDTVDRTLEYMRDVSNSDLVYYNEYFDTLKNKEYNYSKKQAFMNNKQ